MDIADIRGAVARGWCHPDNANKVMDVDLAEAISQEVATLAAREDGWVLVPREPTYQMCEAGGFKWESPWEGGFPAAYRRMIAAAPPAQGPGEGT